MWVILPVKRLQTAKLRLASLLSQDQRAHFCYLMLSDVLETLRTSDVIAGVTIISSDSSVIEIANNHNAQLLLMESDSGYSVDVKQAISTLCQDHHIDKVAIIPLDVPQITDADLIAMNMAHNDGITLCPATIDGGTNGLVFTPPLKIPLLFGTDSLIKFQSEARKLDIPVNILPIPGLERDIDRPEDVFWLTEQSSGKKAWTYVKGLLQANKKIS